MDKSILKRLTKTVPFAIAAVCYFLICNADTFDLPENYWYIIRLFSFLLSLISGFSFIVLIVIVPVLIYRLIKRNNPVRLLIWTTFMGCLFILDLTFARHFFLDLAKDRIINNAQPIITAIDHYQLDNGKYPKNLQTLVPQYVESIPNVGVDNFEYYNYENLDSTYKFSFWQFAGGRTYRVFVYAPDGNFTNPRANSSFSKLTTMHDSDYDNWKYYYY